MASLRKYTCTCEVTLTPGLFLVNICNICIKIHQKCTKNLVLEPLWGALGAILEFPGNQDAPKRRPRAAKRRQDRNFGGNLTQLGSNSMCFARTAALQCGDEKQKVKASSCLGRNNGTMSKNTPRRRQDRPRWVQDRAKTCQDRPKTSQDRHRQAQDRPQRREKTRPRAKTGQHGPNLAEFRLQFWSM